MARSKWKPVTREVYRARRKVERDLWRLEMLQAGKDPDAEELRAEVLGLLAVVRKREREHGGKR